jgi:hypothetical protein
VARCVVFSNQTGRGPCLRFGLDRDSGTVVCRNGRGDLCQLLHQFGARHRLGFALMHEPGIGRDVMR